MTAIAGKQSNRAHHRAKRLMEGNRFVDVIDRLEDRQCRERGSVLADDSNSAFAKLAPMGVLFAACLKEKRKDVSFMFRKGHVGLKQCRRQDATRCREFRRKMPML